MMFGLVLNADSVSSAAWRSSNRTAAALFLPRTSAMVEISRTSPRRELSVSALMKIPTAVSIATQLVSKVIRVTLFLIG